jgi:prepilin-type N-terminal cleavage/methylation domain-containing protein
MKKICERKQLKGNGFTLLEVLVALSILAIAVTMVLQLFAGNLRTIGASGGTTSAVVKADARIKEILSGDLLVERVWTETTDDGYRINVSIAELLKERTDNLPVKLMEVDLTILWSEGNKGKRFNLRTVKMVDRLSPTDKKPALSG